MRVSPWLRYHADVFPTLATALERVCEMEPESLYLCGGINGLSDSACNDWRSRVRAELPATVRVLDPMARDYRGREDDHVADIVEGDKRDILESRCILVNASRPSWGTAMEIMFAWSLHVPVVAFLGEQ